MITCKTLNLKQKCNYCNKPLLDSDLNCEIVWFTSAIKKDLEYISIKQSILEWIETVRNDHGNLLQFLYLAIKHYFPEHFNYLNMVLLLK
jgi:hypothetical protein